MALVRKLGGAGDEWARALAVAPDGTVLVSTGIGPPEPVELQESWGYVVDTVTKPTLGLVALAPSGAIRWAREYPTGGAWADITWLSSRGGGGWHVYVWAAPPGVDLGGGKITGYVDVELAEDGSFVRQRAFERFPLETYDAAGNRFVATSEGVVRKYGPGGELLWERTSVAERPMSVKVAIDRTGAAILVWGVESSPSRYETHVEKRQPDGSLAWTVGPVQGLTSPSVTDDGTIVLEGAFEGSLQVGDHGAMAPGPGWRWYVAALGADGRSRWIRVREGVGPSAVTPDGRILLLGEDQSFPEPRWARYPGCDHVLVTWNVRGDTVDRRRVAACSAAFPHGPFWTAIAAARDGRVWLLGDADAPFTAGDMGLEPAARDTFVLRLDRDEGAASARTSGVLTTRERGD